MFSSENFTSNQKFWAICDLIKNFEESLYLWHTWTWTCDTLVANSSHAAKHNCQVFLFLFQMFAAFQILETPTLFCVFVPFVFKLWLSGSILHLSSNLVPLTPSYHLQTCGTQKIDLIQIACYLSLFVISFHW